MDKQQEIAEKLNQLEKTVWVLLKQTIPALEGELGDETKLGQALQDVKGQVGTITQDVASLQSAVATLESQMDARGRLVEVVYDMGSSDEAVNQGYGSGVQSGGQIVWQGDYDFLRIYASLGGMLAYLEIPVNNRPRHDIVLRALSATGKTFHLFKGIIYNDDKRINLGKTFTYTMDEGTGTFAFSSEVQSTYYVTRVEGVKGL